MPIPARQSKKVYPDNSSLKMLAQAPPDIQAHFLSHIDKLYFSIENSTELVAVARTGGDPAKLEKTLNLLRPYRRKMDSFPLVSQLLKFVQDPRVPFGNFKRPLFESILDVTLDQSIIDGTTDTNKDIKALDHILSQALDYDRRHIYNFEQFVNDNLESGIFLSSYRKMLFDGLKMPPTSVHVNKGTAQYYFCLAHLIREYMVYECLRDGMPQDKLPGAIDMRQVVYVPMVDAFITNDRALGNMVRKLGILPGPWVGVYTTPYFHAAEAGKHW